MLIKSILIELRSRLRSCNVYITTGIDFTKNCNLKISIQASCIVLNYYPNCDNDIKRRDSLSSIESLSDHSENETEVTSVIPIEQFQIIPNSMSSLRIDKNNISFRILTEPTTGGNFYKEYLPADTENKLNKTNELKINVRVNDELKILCSNCSNVISNDVVKFDRILELPSTNMDMSEWFCHGHGHNSQNNGGLAPNERDFLHRLTFFVVNNIVLADKTNKFNAKRTVYHCNRCLAWLGLKNKNSVRLFNSDIKIHQNGVDKAAFAHKTVTQNKAIDDFIFTIEKMMLEFSLGLQYSIMYKIVLECSIATEKKQYLLIWIMDKELQILKNTDQIGTDKIKLQSSLLTKILYKLELSLNEEVETWLADPTVLSTEISKTMFVQGVEHLRNMSLKVPEPFRYTNGYCVSYLKV